MKNKLLFILLLFISFIGYVNAKPIESLVQRWEKTSQTIKRVDNLGDSYLVFSENKITKYYKNKTNDIVEREFDSSSNYQLAFDGENIYLFVDHQESANEFMILDKNLNTKNSLELDFGSLTYFTIEDGTYKIFYQNSDNYDYTLIYKQYNSNLELIDEKEFPVANYVHYRGSQNGAIYFNTYDNKTYRFNGSFQEVSASSIPLNLPMDGLWNNRSEINNDEQIDSQIYDRIYATETLSNPSAELFLEVKKDGENYVALFYESFSSANSHSFKIPVYRSTLKYFDKNLNVKWKVDLPEEATDEGICGSTNRRTLLDVYEGNIVLASNRKNKQFLKVFDSNGKVLKDLSEDIAASPKHAPIALSIEEDNLFIVYQEGYMECMSKNENNNKIMPTFLADTLEDRPSAYIYYYESRYKIDTVVTEGKGSIKIESSSADKNEPVEVIITPDEGYILGVVRVIDANGNVLTFTDNKFTMPSSDVTIEVEFLVANANTTDVAIMVAVVLSAFALIMLIISKKAIKE